MTGQMTAVEKLFFGKKIAARGGCLKNLPEATGVVFWV